MAESSSAACCGLWSSFVQLECDRSCAVFLSACCKCPAHPTSGLLTALPLPLCSTTCADLQDESPAEMKIEITLRVPWHVVVEEYWDKEEPFDPK